MRTFIAFFCFTSLLVTSASASTLDQRGFLPNHPPRDVWHVDWLSNSRDAALVATGGHLRLYPAFAQGTNQPVHAAAIEHSDAYLTRAKIHRYASYATLPLFAAELALGASIYNGVDHGDWKKSAHGAVGAAIVGLFGVNTVTGAWNLFGEGWSDQGRSLRVLHGLLMMAADAGFVATSMSTPSEHRGFTFQADRNTHRNLALTSIGVGTTGYLVMLFGHH
jgi:hypothetical protein